MTSGTQPFQQLVQDLHFPRAAYQLFVNLKLLCRWIQGVF